ncbi:MAG: aspartate--tRNA ligase [Acholeplasmatales bacterium]|jgi:aspartyl-tRNA synthetase|nr:aspartate--tRNA ligase [Acholeplasmatales bacterium]
MKYTHHNNELNKTHLQQEVYLKGWVSKKRNLGSLIFIDLRDRFGITQITINDQSPLFLKAESLKSEWVIEVKGIVKLRSSINNNIATGEIEIDAGELNILNTSEPLPFPIVNDTNTLEDTRLKYRYLDLRRPVQAKYLLDKSKITGIIRHTLEKEGFYELETPILGKSTPEGARDFLVPSRLYHGSFYALPQSPQIFKQLYQIAGFEKYYQIARCFRDEDLRADRQLEFSQVDIEASFVEEKDIQDLAEKILKNLFKKFLNIAIKTPFLRMTYAQAIKDYGSDKPDRRFALLLQDADAFQEHLSFLNDQYLRALRVHHPSFTRKDYDDYLKVIKQNHGNNLIYIKNNGSDYSSSVAKYLTPEFLSQLNLAPQEVIFLSSSNDYENLSIALGALRIKVANDLKLIDETSYAPLWVVDFPLFEYDTLENRLVARHHPFTAAKNFDDLQTNPATALAKAYDIVLNGYEIGGGSIRIHNSQNQKKVFELLKLSENDINNRFGFLIEALKYGTPPHGGIALGLDRIVMLLTHTNNIKDVTAFPKTQSARDLMMEAPSEIDDDQLKEVGLQCRKD